jgi:hypothetical protein
MEENDPIPTHCIKRQTKAQLTLRGLTVQYQEDQIS